MFKQWLKRPRNQKLVRVLLAAAIGTAVGLSCGYLPEPIQPACRFAAKAIGILGGR